MSAIMLSQLGYAYQAYIMEQRGQHSEDTMRKAAGLMAAYDSGRCCAYYDDDPLQRAETWPAGHMHLTAFWYGFIDQMADINDWEQQTQDYRDELEEERLGWLT